MGQGRGPGRRPLFGGNKKIYEPQPQNLPAPLPAPFPHGNAAPNPFPIEINGNTQKDFNLVREGFTFPTVVVGINVFYKVQELDTVGSN